MALLARRLKAEGYTPVTFGYFVHRESVDEIVDRYVERVRETVDDGEPYAVVGHSLGNLVTRLASPRLPAGFSRFVMLAPPNQPSALARTFRDNPVFRGITRDAGRALGDPAFYDRIPVPDVPSLIVAGTKGPRASWLPFGGAPNDGIVSVEETRLPGIPSREVHGVHTFLMNRKDVFALIRSFLEQPESIREFES